jgi:hypothetical protein
MVPRGGWAAALVQQGEGTPADAGDMRARCGFGIGVGAGAWIKWRRGKGLDRECGCAGDDGGFRPAQKRNVRVYIYIY